MMCLTCLKKRISDNTKVLNTLKVGSENYKNLLSVVQSDRKRLVDYLNVIKQNNVGSYGGNSFT